LIFSEEAFQMFRVNLFACLFALLVAACGPSRGDLETEAKKLLQEVVDENQTLHAAGLTIESAQLVHESGTKYAGIATVVMRGTGRHSVPFTLLSDGDRVMVHTDPGVFAWAIELTPTDMSKSDQAGDQLPQSVSPGTSHADPHDTSGWPERAVTAEPWLTPYGACFVTTVARIETRLENTPGSGSAISYANGAYQVSYEAEPAIESSVQGDTVRLCVVDRDKTCLAKDERGNTYQAKNLRTGAVWELPDSEHECDGT
jgi:hypothetical protein